MFIFYDKFCFTEILIYKYLCIRNRETPIAIFFYLSLKWSINCEACPSLAPVQLWDAHPLCKSSLKLLGYEQREDVPQ